MAWNQKPIMEQKQQFVSLAATGRFTFTQLCADYHISRKNGHKWLGRYRQEGMAGLRERSRRPHGCSHQTVLRANQMGSGFVVCGRNTGCPSNQANRTGSGFAICS